VKVAFDKIKDVQMYIDNISRSNE